MDARLLELVGKSEPDKLYLDDVSEGFDSSEDKERALVYLPRFRTL